MNVEDEDLPGGEAEASLRDDLAAALTAASEADNAGGVDTSLDTPTDPAPREDGRDERGRFAPKAKEEGEGGDPADTPPGEPASDPAAEAPPAAPKSWRQEEAAEWAGMTPAARAAVERREREMSVIIGRQDGERSFGREFADIIRPHAETIAGFGVTPQLAVKTLLENDRLMRSRDPADLPRKVHLAYEMLRDYGLDPAAFTEPPPGASTDPTVRALQIEVQQLRAAGGKAQQPDYAPLPGTDEEATIGSDIEAFRSDPAHPHFDQVFATMARLLEADAATGLEEAYQMAVAANPSLRSTPAPVDPAPTQRSQEKVTAARRAGVSITGSPGTAAPARPGSLRDELAENLRRLGFN